LDIWNITNDGLNFSSDEIIITINTLWAAFNVNMSQNSDFSYWWETIINWDWLEWVWYDKTSYSWINLNINSNPSLYTQTAVLNTNWEYNSYEYRVKIWTLIWELQTAWNYEATLSFYLYLTY
jgi:hypothetical protein